MYRRCRRLATPAHCGRTSNRRRWLEERDDSPWYPGVMRLFRQSVEDAEKGYWSNVAVKRGGVAGLIALALCEKIKKGRWWQL